MRKATPFIRVLFFLLPVTVFCGGAVYSATDANESKPESKPETVGDEELAIVINGEPINGRPILPASEKEFKFKLAETGDILTFQWAVLDEYERKRVQKIYGLAIEGDRVIFGNKIMGVRIKLDNGKTIEGLEIPERSGDGKVALRNNNTPLMIIYEREIVSKDPLEMYESEVYKARDIYDRIMLEQPPGNDAAAHVAVAKQAANMRLYKEALDELKKAEILDPRTVERNQGMREELIQKHMEQEGDRLWNELEKDISSSDFFAAKDVYDQLERSFPNHTKRSRWESLSPQIEDGTKVQLEKKVIQLSYFVAQNLLEQRYYKKTKVDLKNNIVPALPGKQITTKHGDLFRGTLVDPDPNGDLKIMVFDPSAGVVSNTTLTIKAKEVMTVKDVDLSTGAKEISPTLDELKTYVTDLTSPTGLKKEMFVRIGQMLKNVPEAKLIEIFDKRLSKEAVYDGGQVTMSKNWTTLHEASYGMSSWLREGSKPLPSPFAQLNRPAQDQNNIWNRINNNNNLNNQKKQPSQDDDPDMTDDPEVWWKFQNSNPTLQVGYLKALMAEKVFSPRPVLKEACSLCHGTGLISVVGPGGDHIGIRCPSCRGLGVFFHIRYE